MSDNITSGLRGDSDTNLLVQVSVRSSVFVVEHFTGADVSSAVTVFSKNGINRICSFPLVALDDLDAKKVCT